MVVDGDFFHHSYEVFFPVFTGVAFSGFYVHEFGAGESCCECCEGFLARPADSDEHEVTTLEGKYSGYSGHVFDGVSEEDEVQFGIFHHVIFDHFEKFLQILGLLVESVFHINVFVKEVTENERQFLPKLGFNGPVEFEPNEAGFHEGVQEPVSIYSKGSDGFGVINKMD